MAIYFPSIQVPPLLEMEIYTHLSRQKCFITCQSETDLRKSNAQNVYLRKETMEKCEKKNGVITHWNNINNCWPFSNDDDEYE